MDTTNIFDPYDNDFTMDEHVRGSTLTKKNVNL